MHGSQYSNLLIIVFGLMFFVGGLVMAARAWWTGGRWKEPGAQATALQIERVANLRVGAAVTLGGGDVVAMGILLATASQALLNYWPFETAVSIPFLGIGLLFVLLMRSGVKLYSRASNVRVRDSMPRRPRLYLVWPPPGPDKDNSNPN